MRKSSTVLTTAVSAFILVSGLMLLPAVSRGFAMSMTTAPATSMQSMQTAGLNFAMDSGGFNASQCADSPKYDAKRGSSSQDLVGKHMRQTLLYLREM